MYLTHIPHSDIDNQMVRRMIDSMKESCRFFEIKLFFIHTHFDLMDIGLLNYLVDTLQLVFFRTDLKSNPALSQYNTVKLSLLVYRVSWRIQEKKIYSLTTKCQILNKYILGSLWKFLEQFHDVA